MGVSDVRGSDQTLQPFSIFSSPLFSGVPSTLNLILNINFIPLMQCKSDSSNHPTVVAELFSDHPAAFLVKHPPYQLFKWNSPYMYENQKLYALSLRGM